MGEDVEGSWEVWGCDDADVELSKTPAKDESNHTKAPRFRAVEKSTSARKSS
jgi:hypothetical protein